VKRLKEKILEVEQECKKAQDNAQVVSKQEAHNLITEKLAARSE
jgi:hypothetical protein